ncbi:MAG: RNA 3'-terminal phosphate cyclase [Candidatus Thermoplasmatota archaeon]|nr:RNA 3'-terminal phosphate cyclase [Candidatus Thermoplasmatota archaeon]
MIVIDGSYGEGGGQILRTAVALSALTKKPVRVVNVRAKRSKPGLQAQHLTAVKSVAELCSAEVKGLEKNSKELEFYPGKLKGGEFKLDVGTAGSVTLVLQCCLLSSIFSSSQVRLSITGGTDVKFAPPIDYFKNVFLKLLEKLGIEAELELIRRGYYPRGGGEVEILIKPVKEIKPLSLERGGSLKQVEGLCFISNLPDNILKRIKHSALKELINYPTKIEENVSLAYGQSAGITLWADYESTCLGSSCLGEKGLPAEKVGSEAALNLLKEINSGATLDIHAADQILPYLALAKGESKFLVRELSLHAQTNMWLIKNFLDVEFEVVDEKGLKKIKVQP